MESATFFSLGNWPVLLLCVALIVEAVIDFWKLKVPNRLTYPIIIAGWLYGAAHDLGWLTSANYEPGLIPSVLLTFFAMALVIPVYAIGGMGAGDVKMLMGFGAWIGAFFGIVPGYETVLWGFLVGVVVGGIIALGQMAWRGDFYTNLANLQEIKHDLLTSKNVYEIADKAAARKPRLQLLPYGVPLCIGFVGYLIFSGLSVAG